VTIAPIALAWHRAGFVAVPVKSDGSKAPGLANWLEYQTRLPNQTELRNWWTVPRQGFGLIMGAVSGNAEMLEFEGRAVDRIPEVLLRARERNIYDTFVKLWTGYRELTPGGGIHLVFRVSDGPSLPNTKIAQRPATAEELLVKPQQKVYPLIETRGEGGFTVTAPSNGTTHPNGGQWTLQAGTAGVVPTLTCAERDNLYDLLRTFDEMPVTATSRVDLQPRNSQDVFSANSSGHVSPLDAFNAEADWGQILIPHGWIHDHIDKDGVAYWIRPGKDTPGISATTGRSDTGDRLYVFSSSTPFEQEVPHNKAFVWAHYNTGGDLKAAAAKLYEDGWGDRRRDNTIVIGDDRPWFLPEEFWETRPVFEHLRRAAWSRMASPEGVLVAALCLTLYYTEPNVFLSAPVGSEAPLNLLATLCGNPSDGKSVCRKLAIEALDFVDAKPFHSFGPSSGQGISKQYQYMKKPRGQEPYMETVRTSAFALAEEIDSIKAQSSMQGSTLSSELRKAAMGEALGSGNVGETATNLAEGTYRFVMLVCTQPELAGWLLDGAAGGLPQRFLWCSVRDPRIVDDIEFPAKMPVRLPFEAKPAPDDGFGYGAPRARWVMQGTPRIASEIRQAAREAKMSGDDDVNLDGHALLTRRKVSAALALLDGRNNDNDEDWELADMIMEMSDASREWVKERVAIAAARENEQKAKARGRGRHIENQTVAKLEVEAEETLEQRTIEFIQEAGEVSVRDIQRKLRARSEDVHALLVDLERRGIVEMTQQARGSAMVKLV
jgi:hypothetical protein